MNVTTRTAPKKILIAIDGSEHSYAATELICSLPLGDRCSVNLVSVIIPRRGQFHGGVQAALDKAVGIMQRSDAGVTPVILSGYPSEELMKCADEERPDLIVMGAKGLRATFGIFLGGVAQQVVEYAKCPVLIVREKYQELKKILVVTDGSTYSENALEFVGEFCFPEDAAFEIMHVLPPLLTHEYITRTWPIGVDMVPVIPDEDIQKSIEIQTREENEFADTLMRRSEKILSEHGIKAEPLIKRGDAASEIIEYAKERKLDLIVAGSRGLNSLQGWLLGSVSRKLVHYAPCSVMIIKMAED